MFRVLPKISSEDVRRTFEGVRRSLEPTLLTKHLHYTFHDVETDIDGGWFPIPLHFSASSSAQKAWSTGSMDIRHQCSHTTRTVTVKVIAASIGGAPSVLATTVCALGVGAVLQQFTAYLIGVDLTPYDAVGCRYTIDAAPADPLTISTAITWRPDIL